MRALLSGFGVSLVTLAAGLSTPSWAGDVTIRLDAGDGFVLEESSGAIERLRVEEASGNLSRNGALFVHTTGSESTFVGAGAGNTAASDAVQNTAFGSEALQASAPLPGPPFLGSFNSAFGAKALTANTTGRSNSAFGRRTLPVNTTGSSNSAFGDVALFSNTTGSFNAAFAQSALQSNATGNYNAAFGNNALQGNVAGSSNSAFGEGALRSNTASGNSAFGRSALELNTAGIRNAAFGDAALMLSTGSDNSAFGSGTLTANTSGYRNSAFGRAAMRDNTTGYSNDAFGELALQGSTTGSYNSAFGRDALGSATTASFNVAVGSGALRNSTGSSNVAVGAFAGAFLTSGTSNIYLANIGVSSESGQIRIGDPNVQTGAHVAGIYGSTSASGIAVYVDAAGTLGTATSSARFKRNIRDLGDASDVLRQLRPVAFEYRDDVVEAGGEGLPQVGLIAEEVARVAPELVSFAEDGSPYTVRYRMLAPMLLNELQKQQRRSERQAALIAEQREAVAELMARMERLEGSRTDL